MTPDGILVLLWFGTYKNGSNHYMPRWMKLDPQRYPNIIGADRKYVDSPSALAPDTLQADIGAFTSLMRHLKETDEEHTVLMVQVENEPGAWGAVRDYSPEAQKSFDGPAPGEVLSSMQKSARPGTTWAQAFGDDAAEYFQVWCVSRFVGQVAAAGKVVYPLPMYVNSSVRDPFRPGYPPRYEVGGPNDNVFTIWKAEAPAVDLLAPDIYQRETAHYLRIIDYFARADNPLFIPETIGQGTYARFLFAALGHGAIGFSPFGMDYTRTFATPAEPGMTAEEAMAPTALNYQLIGPISREIARLNFEGKVQTSVDLHNPPDLRIALGGAPPPPAEPATEPDDPLAARPDDLLHFGSWDARIWFRPMRRGAGPATRPAEPAAPNGRAMVAQLGENEFLVTGLYCRIGFAPAGPIAHTPWQYLSVEEGKYIDGVFEADRILNGDQTDWGMTFGTTPQVLRVTVYTR
jgi:hypothetical protein